jgi:hypothetical protein
MGCGCWGCSPPAASPSSAHPHVLALETITQKCDSLPCLRPWQHLPWGQSLFARNGSPIPGWRSRWATERYVHYWRFPSLCSPSSSRATTRTGGGFLWLKAVDPRPIMGKVPALVRRSCETEAQTHGCQGRGCTLQQAQGSRLKDSRRGCSKPLDGAQQGRHHSSMHSLCVVPRVAAVESAFNADTKRRRHQRPDARTQKTTSHARQTRWRSCCFQGWWRPPSVCSRPATSNNRATAGGATA